MIMLNDSEVGEHKGLNFTTESNKLLVNTYDITVNEATGSLSSEQG